MFENVVIKTSRINGKGVFANSDFSKGEIVLTWKPKPIKKTEIGKLSEKEKMYIVKGRKKFYVMQAPEKYVNHSCDPNTIAKNKSDVALRNIKKGEEITSNYSGRGIDSFKCRCGSGACEKLIN